MKVSKYIKQYVVQGKYCNGWEDLTSTEDLKEAKSDLKAYRDNEGGCFRLITRRIKNTYESK